MNPRLVLCLILISAVILVAVGWRLFAIYRRRRRWQMLMTSHQSLHIARNRIVASPEAPDED